MIGLLCWWFIICSFSFISNRSERIQKAAATTSTSSSSSGVLSRSNCTKEGSGGGSGNYDFPFDRFTLCLQEYRRIEQFLGNSRDLRQRRSLLLLTRSFDLWSVDDLVQSHEFQYQYEDLLSIRLKFQRSFKKYESSLDQYQQYLTQHAETLQQISDFRSKYTKVCYLSWSSHLTILFLICILLV